MPQIAYFYSVQSAFAYLGAQWLARICVDHGCDLPRRPINLGPVVAGGGGLSYAQRTQAHVDDFFSRDVERWAEWREVEIINFRPTHHNNPLDWVVGC